MKNFKKEHDGMQNITLIGMMVILITLAMWYVVRWRNGQDVVTKPDWNKIWWIAMIWVEEGDNTSEWAEEIRTNFYWWKYLMRWGNYRCLHGVLVIKSWKRYMRGDGSEALCNEVDGCEISGSKVNRYNRYYLRVRAVDHSERRLFKGFDATPSKIQCAKSAR